MPRTNVVGTTAAAGSGAQRCAQAGEREHRTDSTTGTAVTTAANRLSPAARAADSRNSLQFHPLADIFPLMEGEEFDALVADIKANGLYLPIELYDGMILDGRNRYRAVRALGWHPDRIEEQTLTAGPSGTDTHLRVDDPVAYVISKNIHRRHLTAEEKIKYVAQLVAAQPEKSDRLLAKETGVSHPTIAKARRAAEATGKALPVGKRVGADGKARTRPAKRAKPEAKAKAKAKVPKHDSRIIAPKLAYRVGPTARSARCDHAPPVPAGRRRRDRAPHCRRATQGPTCGPDRQRQDGDRL